MNHEVSFTATTCSCYTEDDVLVIALGDDPVSPDNYLIMGRFDDGDADESIGLQFHFSAYEVACAIENLSLSRNTLAITVKADKVKFVGCHRATVSFADGVVDIEELSDYLKELVEGSNIELALLLAE